MWAATRRRSSIGAVFLCLLGACDAYDPETQGSGVPTGIRFLSSADTATDDFALVTTPRAFDFPSDHSAHPEYRTEWWYFTGNLHGEGGRHYGFELTFFRYALAPTAPSSDSAWSSNQVYMAHLAVTDSQGDRMLAEERLTRGALGLAGAEPEPLRVWVENWSIEAGPDGDPMSFVIDARGDRIAVQLELAAQKPPVAHGDDGVDPKGPEPGNASYYYSLTRLAASGTVAVDGNREAVAGTAWMDREWSTSALSPNVEGWDWFALQLSNGADLMLYRLRQVDGSTSPFSGGSLVDADGGRIGLGPDDFRLAALAEWQSPRSGTIYPVAWRIEVANARLELEIRPYVDDQEILLSVRYWEGAVRIDGQQAGEPVEGSGYLELAGY